MKKVYRSLPRKSKGRNKFNAKKCTIDGITFDSGLEGRTYLEYKLEVRGGYIKDLKIHPVYPIYIKDIKVCDVELDFEFYDCRVDKVRFIDCKGMILPMSVLKRKMVEAYYSIKVEWI